jgi:hypothetical protein
VGGTPLDDRIERGGVVVAVMDHGVSNRRFFKVGDEGSTKRAKPLSARKTPAFKQAPGRRAPA